MKKALEYRNCFVCGKDSVNGLKVSFETTEEGTRAVYTPTGQFEGFRGVVHGGILTALLDEIMWKAINAHTGNIVMTAKLEIRFRKPARIGVQLLIEGKVQGKKRNLFETRGVIYDPDGTIVAEASGIFAEPDAESAVLLAEGLD